MYDITCVGHICCDILVKPLNSLPEKGKLSLNNSFKMQLGGCGANSAIDIAKLGLKTCFCGKIGNDGFGRFLTETLKNEGVDINYLCVSDEDETSASIVAISDDGERSVVHSVGANATFNTNDIDFDILDKSKILFIGGTNLMDSFDGENAAYLLKTAKQKGVLTCMDTAWDAKGKWMKKIKSSIEYLDWFMPSYDEAVCLADGEKEPEKIADYFMSIGSKNVVIKLGKKGCYVKTPDEEFYMSGFDRIKAVDTSGAGDSFCAGFLTGLSKGYSPEACARLANAVGTFCVMQIGTTTGIKDISVIEKFIEEYENQ